MFYKGEYFGRNIHLHLAGVDGGNVTIFCFSPALQENCLNRRELPVKKQGLAERWCTDCLEYLQRIDTHENL